MSQANITERHKAPANWLDRRARSLVIGKLRDLAFGQIVLHDSEGTVLLGQPSVVQANLYVHQPRFYRHAILGGTLAVAESYLRGDWDCDDLTALFRIFVRNRQTSGRFDRGLARLGGFAHRLFHRWHANSRTGSRRNIGAHYDLGNDFFRLWLDDTLAYSSGIFPTAAATMQEASVEKFDRVCRMLRLRATDQVLEIGSGWGGFAIHAAKNYGCHVTTTTISKEQFDFVQQRINAEGISDRIQLLQRDYRELKGQFDKLVSIEMIEAVGHEYLDQYFGQCSSLLKPDGSLFLQAIVMPEHSYGPYLKSVDFIQRYVFPGGCLPSLGAIMGSVGRSTDLRLVQADDFAPHYAETLRRWRAAFGNQLDQVRQQGYSDEFIRLWNYYLCYCEAAFEERHVGVLQVQFNKPLCRDDAMDFTPTVTTPHEVEVRRSNEYSSSNEISSTERPAVQSIRERSFCQQ
ncbi:MAG: cyclopropane-fatty-acyl-phospholipid synthase family protein [Planctomycetota bacterium]|nr:cyclopropane-fatty-acyl-phospholipid synthase family protein [Planctomycetota bacterium]